MEKHGRRMLSHFPAFRFTVAHQMEAYRERMAQRIRREAAKRAERPLDLAHAIDVHTSTVERWFRGERTPQPRLRKKLAEHWDIEPGELEPDPEAEARELQAQLDRIERTVAAIARKVGADVDAEELAQALEQASGASPPAPERKRPSKAKRSAARPASG